MGWPKSRISNINTQTLMSEDIQKVSNFNLAVLALGSALE